MQVPSGQERSVEGRYQLRHERHRRLQNLPFQALLLRRRSIIRWLAWVVVPLRVYPAAEQSLVPILQASKIMEELVRLGHIKTTPIFLGKGEVDNIVAGSFRLLQPFSVRRPLDTVCWPISRIHSRLCDVERSRFPQCHCNVAGPASHPPCQHRVQPIQADDTKHVARVDVRLVKDHFPWLLPGCHRDSNVVMQERCISGSCTRGDILSGNRDEKQRRLHEIVDCFQEADR
mmetsp:Transcript_61484/g.146660  ORF Transcript_61484/g.146660 Transcript_61484/m.146660 type:complete len:231 (-) Transcript_61484:788-1480(-)